MVIRERRGRRGGFASKTPLLPLFKKNEMSFRIAPPWRRRNEESLSYEVYNPSLNLFVIPDSHIIKSKKKSLECFYLLIKNFK